MTTSTPDVRIASDLASFARHLRAHAAITNHNSFDITYRDTTGRVRTPVYIRVEPYGGTIQTHVTLDRSGREVGVSKRLMDCLATLCERHLEFVVAREDKTRFLVSFLRTG